MSQQPTTNSQQPSHGTAIEWTHVPGYRGETLNISTGCNKISPGCKNCYAARDWARLSSFPNTVYAGRKFEDFQVHTDRFQKPREWQKPRSIFVNSMSDIFHEKMSESHLYWFFNIMLEVDRHVYMILTKRHERMQRVITKMCDDFYLYRLPPHIWIGVSIENQEMGKARIPCLLNTPASTRFLSVEPLLEKIWLTFNHLHGIHWIITGGESGPKNRIRTCNLDWIRDIRYQCQIFCIPFFHKQHGGSSKIDPEGSGQAVWGGRVLDGRTWDEFPVYLSNQ